MKYGFAGLLLMFAITVSAQTQVPNTFVDGEVIEADEFNENFDALGSAIDAIPAGPAGPAGADGAQGPVGPQGPAGAGGVTNASDGINVTGAGTAGDPYVVSKAVPAVGDAFAGGTVGGVIAMTAGGVTMGYKIVVYRESGFTRQFGADGVVLTQVGSFRSGRMATSTLLAVDPVTLSAAAECQQQVANGALSATLTADWYLPSSDEFFGLISRLNGASANTLTDDPYWTSSPQSNSSTQAIARNGSTGDQFLSAGNPQRTDVLKVVCLQDVFI